MKSITFNHQNSSSIGIGTWHIGEGNNKKSTAEIQSIRYGLDHGINVIDTAEMYGDGKAELLIGQVLPDYDRQKLQLISKFYPNHATPKLIEESLKASLKRLQTDYLDLYLLHWRGEIPLEETVFGLEKMVQAGLIKHWGVSNFDRLDLEELWNIPNGQNCRVNEDLYNIGSRGVEYTILPWQKKHHVSFIGYSPFGSDNSEFLKIKPIVKDLADQKQVTVHQLLLAWVLRNHDILSIPKTSSLAHMKDNLAAVEVTFSTQELDQLAAAYPEPKHEEQLESI